MTDESNLASVLEYGGLCCYNTLDGASIEYVDIAYENIQQRRAAQQIPCGPGGTLHDYVPFFFGPRPPMLYTISRGNVRDRIQDTIVHLVSTVDTVEEAGLPFVFTDGHAIVAVTKFFADRAKLGAVDWPLMGERYWHDTQADPDRKRRRQAEFLVHDFFPWELVAGIGVKSASVRKRVEATLAAYGGHSPSVVVHPDWYY